MENNITKTKLREFGLLVGFGFPIIFGLIFPFIQGHGIRVWTVFIGIPLVLLSILKPRFLYIPYKSWMKLGFFLGWLNIHIVLGIVFIFVVQPISLIMKVLGHDPMKKNYNASLKSYKEDKKHHKIDLNKIF